MRRVSNDGIIFGEMINNCLATNFLIMSIIKFIVFGAFLLNLIEFKEMKIFKPLIFDSKFTKLLFAKIFLASPSQKKLSFASINDHLIICECKIINFKFDHIRNGDWLIDSIINEP